MDTGLVGFSPVATVMRLFERVTFGAALLAAIFGALFGALVSWMFTGESRPARDDAWDDDHP